MDILATYLAILPLLCTITIGLLMLDMYSNTGWHWQGHYYPTLFGWIAIAISLPWSFIFIALITYTSRQIIPTKEQRIENIKQTIKKLEEEQ